ncbi:response regulator [Paucibacter sp. APW11]|uniref:Response regulator n=1 Tax=Roseateles aquae TaxID=3077235 RepID=A0ABU3P6P0_9BURK|nr:response regulator [Paucibacter sp. APW11]MDT8998237.1 response regulator [Paucibacter sp. APW11]
MSLTTATPPASSAARRVLIVDDSRAIQSIIRHALECGELGPMQIQTANNGAEALDKVAQFKPDLVLSDWHMPGVSGIEMLQTLRQTGHADMAVGFVTTETNRERLSEAEMNGAAFILNKPFDDKALCQAVSRSLQKRPTTVTSKPPGHGPQALESINQTQQMMFAHLGTRHFDLRRAEGFSNFAEYPQFIALYSSTGRKSVYAVGLLDIAACCLIGGMAEGSSAEQIQLATQIAQPAAKWLDHASRFMRALAPVLVKRSASDQPSLGAARLTLQPFDKLAMLLQQNNGRTELRLHVPGYGEGRLCFLLV